MTVNAHLELPGDLASPSRARRFVARTLEPVLGREDVETAMLVTSELVTNATLHAGSSCQLALHVDGPVLFIRVSDADRRIPVRRPAISDQLSTGRGLRLLEVLCERWGVDTEQAGKTVWCRLRVSPS